jgi:O-antigen/teichoic acid export membrane protein
LPRLSREVVRGQLTRGAWVSVAQVAQALLGGSELLIIGKVLGPAAVVPYACTAKLIGFLANQPQLLMQAAAPALSEIKAGADRQRLGPVATALTQAMLLGSGAVVCLVLAVNQGFVGWWLGPSQYGGFGLTVLLLVNLLLRHWNTTAVYSIFCFGYERRISLTTLFDGLLTAGGAFALVPLIGPCGAPLASIASVCLVSLPANLSALAHEAEVSVLALVGALRPWFWRFAVVATSAGSLALCRVPDDFLSLAATSTLIAMAYAAAMLPLALRPPLGVYLRPRLAALWARCAGSPRMEGVHVRVSE